MKFIKQFTQLIYLLPLIFYLCTAPILAQSRYFTGDAGRGIRLAVLDPNSDGLAPNEQWVLSLIQSSMTADFNLYSAMTIVERQQIDRIMREEFRALGTGYYSDEDFVEIGKATNARYVLTGLVRKTPNAYLLELFVMDIESQERIASFPPKAVTLHEIENLSAVKEATASLLSQLGVNLTATGRAELLKPLSITQQQAQTAMARGFSAQRRGTEVEALTFFLQAASLDPSMQAAACNASLLSANINSGNIGDDARAEIEWFDNWLARLSETETFFYNLFSTTAPPFRLVYSTSSISQGRIDYARETTDLSINTELLPNAVWFSSVLQAANTIYDGLNQTGKRSAWQLANWPWTKAVPTNQSAFTPAFSKQYDFTIAFELVNNMGAVIGRQTLNVRPSFRVVRKQNNQIDIDYTRSLSNTVTFRGVKADDISSNMTVRVATINGVDPVQIGLVLE